MLPEAAEAIRIADKYLPREPMKRRMALAKEISDAITKNAGAIANELIQDALRRAKPTAVSQGKEA